MRDGRFIGLFISRDIDLGNLRKDAVEDGDGNVGKTKLIAQDKKRT